MVEICQNELPILPWADPRTARLPGLNPVEPGQWLQIDDVYSAQMAHRLFLMREHGARVHKLSDGARAAAEELLEDVLTEISDKEGFEVQANVVRCPDGRLVLLDRSQPLLTL